VTVGDDAAYAKLLARFAEWEELEALGYVTLKVIRERMTSEGRIYNAVALITPEGNEFLKDHADEFGG
jgi:hypothetical protein